MDWFGRRKRREQQRLQDMLEAGFDSSYYLEQVGSAGTGDLSPVAHFHRHGWKQGLDPARWFSVHGYLERYPDVRVGEHNPFLHFAQFGKAEGRDPSPWQLRAPGFAVLNQDENGHADSRAGAGSVIAQSSGEIALVSEHIDAEHYSGQAGIPGMSAVDAAAHYLNVGWRLGLSPSPDFDSQHYVDTHDDIRSAGINPFVHFLTVGQGEGRASRAADLRPTPIKGDGRSEWRHYGMLRDRAVRSLSEVGEPKPGLLDFTVALAGTDLIRAVKAERLRGASEGTTAPLVSVVIPCWEEAMVTAECLVSVMKASGDVPIEIILVDNGSLDPFFAGIAEHADIRTVRLAENIGFGPGVNAGVEQARGKFALILNNDAQVAPDAIAAMVAAFDRDPRIAVVGPKIISFDGRLQEAGTLLNADGTGFLIGFAANPDEPRFNYARFVEHLSAAAILIRTDIFREAGGFDDVYAPAYCEDADLSLKLRKAGFRLMYEPDALVAHHLSKSTEATGKAKAQPSTKEQRIRRNRAELLRRWSSELTTFDIRTIAFYLPQYHPIPENDRWWGKGFTEWTNLTRTDAKFEGHRQPRRPADLGYYDLRVSEVMEQQAALARRYGVSGFCYYYYRFGDQRLLEKPIERMLETGRPDFPFCLCWANENWSRRWDGEDQDILMEQKYGDSDAVDFAKDVARFFTSKNYITIDGKPLILIYRLHEIPLPSRFVQICRNTWRELGFEDVVVAMVESFHLSASPQPPQQYGADLTVEFPAHGMVHDPAIPVRRLDPEWRGNAHDYRELASAFMKREEVGFKRLRSVLVGWDTTPRHPTKSFVLQNANPGAFQAWIEWTYRRTREQNFGDERLVFINAWNEWCEGSYLEPDTDFGHGYLQAIRNAQESVTYGKECFVEIA